MNRSASRIGVNRMPQVMLGLALIVAASTALAASPTLEKIRARGSIVIAHRQASIPFSYVDGKGQAIGYSMDLCLRVAEAVRRELKMPTLRTELLLVQTAERLPTIASGRADLECGNTTNTAERRKQVAFSVTHFFAGGRLLVRKGSNVTSLFDLRGRAVTATRTSTAATYLKDKIETRVLDVRLVEAADADQAFVLLREGKVEAFLHDDIILYGLRANAADPAAFEIVGPLVTVEPYGMVLPRDDPEFKRLVDFTLARLMIDGEIKAIYERWFNAPIPPKGLNLGVPMSTLLREQLRFPSDKVGDALDG
jgi:ABC-type amino acid transport substrate-binding protein